MSKESEYSFELRGRNYQINEKDFSTKKDKVLYKMLLADKSAFSMLDQENGTKGVITSNDINIFLESSAAKKKKITQEDVFNFLAKVQTLCPTKKEKAYSSFSFTDENGDNILTNEVMDYFGENRKYTASKDIVDENGDIKKGFEIFDLNNDGKIDKSERDFIVNMTLKSKAPSGYQQIKDVYKLLDEAGTSDGVITDQEKAAVYKKLSSENNKNSYNSLLGTKILSNGKPIMNDELKDMFKDYNAEIDLDNLVDETGKVKKGFEIFDLNNDGKIDNKEKAYFTSGGHPMSKNGDILTVDNFLKAVENLDSFGFDTRYGYAKRDDKISDSDRQKLYKSLDAVYYFMEQIKNLPEDVQQKYTDALTKVTLGDYNKSDSIGVQRASQICANVNSAQKEELASILIHELTHYVLSHQKDSVKSYLIQEVETFYMEYKLYSETKKNTGKDPIVKVRQNNRSAVHANIIDSNYMAIVERLKAESNNRVKQGLEPYTEKEIAFKAFFATHYDFYTYQYSDKTSKKDLEAQGETTNFMYLNKNTKI